MFDKRPRTKRELKKLFSNLKRKGITDDMAHILIELCYNETQVMRTSGFYWPGGPDAVLAFDNSTRTLSVTPREPAESAEGADSYTPYFRFYSWAGEAQFNRKYEAQAIELPNEEGLYVIYFDVDEESGTQQLTYVKNPTDRQRAIALIKKVLVAYVYWDAESQQALTVCNDKHGSEINPQLHWITQSSEFAKRYADGGLTLYDYELNGDGTSNDHLKFKVSAGKFWHGDFLIDVPAAGTETNIPVLQWIAGVPRFSLSFIPVIDVSGIGYNSGANVVLAADSGKFVMYHVFATNDTVAGQHVISVTGRGQYDTLADAYAARESEILTLHAEMPQSGKCYLATLFYEANENYTNTAKARMVSVYSGENHNPVTIAEGSKNYLSINEDQELAFDPSNLPTGGEDGEDGREIELQENAGWVEWRYVGDATWTQLFEIPEDGEDGTSAYLYVAYASDASGSDWSLTPTDSLKYRAEIHTSTPITPVEIDFANATWVKYLGDNGSSGTGTSEAPELHLDFEEAGDEFTYNVPYAMKFTSQVSENGDATLSTALNTTLSRYDKLTITATAAGLVSLYGEYVED